MSRRRVAAVELPPWTGEAMLPLPPVDAYLGISYFQCNSYNLTERPRDYCRKFWAGRPGHVR
jgi:hypothetical protein